MFIYIQEALASGKLSLMSIDIDVKTPGYNEDSKTGFTDYAIKFNVSFNTKNGIGNIFTYKMEEGKKAK